MLSLSFLPRGLAILAVLARSALALEPSSQWGHWRGPSGQGVSESASPPVEFSETKNVAWKVAIPGKGSGSPIVWDNKVFVVTAVSDSSAAPAGGRPPQRRGPGGRGGRGGFGRGGGAQAKHSFHIICFDRATGKELWNETAAEAAPGQGTHNTNTFASASPCTDGTHVYAHFGSQGLFCYDMNGKQIWKRTDFGQMNTRNSFGEGSSPTLVDDMIILPWDHEGPSALYALNKLTGETIWKTDRDEPTCWATPVIAETTDGKQIVMNGQNYARAYDLKSGAEIWRCSGQTDRPAASAVVGNDIAFVGSGYRGSFMGAFRLTGKGDIQGSDNVIWSIKRDTPDVASPLLVGNRLYFFAARKGILSCIAADTGKVIYSQKRVNGLGEIYASPVAAGGHIYLSDRSGNVVVIKDSDEFEIVSSNSLGETIDATPAPVGKQLFIRTSGHLYCIAS